ncbi:LysE/ArgO family amino acid transporter [Vibrio gazogenes]|uniref:L-lysine exporter family protein LysE/ArgO n=1 Tax=Vibrio gazogenes DSM 21264 = NBRC 103151 TaxID=1123492 RepID=A0A1M4UPM0_VIBGA|nr:LysE/ArgO family amino acid transporter [Vibrio gazogenes]USP15716.1 LysE/ArgO family amino acid transporter [Vibrio gazogenes]SHE58607.1 L-lysine exporter family protein LysE/ArgO [Vibrio gazogenes DSM 21264] [Vibrio gazogenes DSM 21264 = NBRC 103151]SJN57697.1 Arginine exporter protein ArgO [Vibrio gazogenes]
MEAFIAGITLGFSLILAIGSQNAFVLKQGLKQQYVFSICIFCALSDAILITIGVYGMATIVSLLPQFSIAAKYFGVAFLIFYGTQNLRSAIWHSGSSLSAEGSDGLPFTKVILTCLAFTWLNPHVYLDTVLLIGSISTNYAEQQLFFTVGAIMASFIFFFALGFGARLLTPIFSKPVYWRVLDGVIALFMYFIAYKLIVMEI